MKRHDKAYFSAWVLLAVFLPTVLLSSIHVHPELLMDGEPCHECIEHTVHNSHIAAIKSTIDCPLCAFQSSVFLVEQEYGLGISQTVTRMTIDIIAPSVTLGVTGLQPGRAPPYTLSA